MALINDQPMAEHHCRHVSNKDSPAGSGELLQTGIEHLGIWCMIGAHICSFGWKIISEGRADSRRDRLAFDLCCRQ